MLRIRRAAAGPREPHRRSLSRQRKSWSNARDLSNDRMFGTVLTVTYTLLLAYAVWRALSVPPCPDRKARLGVVGVGLAAWTVFFLARAYAHDRTGPLAAAIESAGMTLLGSVVLIATTLVVVDLGTLFGGLFRKWAPRLRGGGIVAGMLLSGFAIVQGHRAPAVVSYAVTLPSLPDCLDGTVIVALSDAHFGPHLGEPWWTARVAEMQALRPDAVVFLGDMLEGPGDPQSDWPALRQLSVPLGKWFVDANHDAYRGGSAGPGVLERAGFRRLADPWVELTPGLILAGVNDRSRARRRNLPGESLARALANRPKGATGFWSPVLNA